MKKKTETRNGFRWMIWWTFCDLFKIYEINWWLKRKYFGTDWGVDDEELWKAIKNNPKKIIK